METEFDSIIVGAASPGGVPANRLNAECNKVLRFDAGLRGNRIPIHLRDSENGRASRRNESHNPNAQACLPGAPKCFPAGRAARLGDLQQKLSLSDRTSAGVSHG